ncbi:hypothetical protein FXO37_14926 [Capsicum annuum]|nr:hypothetical protein FXO37_14926 [Capsicum annuum]
MSMGDMMAKLLKGVEATNSGVTTIKIDLTSITITIRSGKIVPGPSVGKPVVDEVVIDELEEGGPVKSEKLDNSYDVLEKGEEKEKKDMQKFMKDLMTKKWKVSHELKDNLLYCGAISTRSLVQKKADPGAFTIPCTIGSLNFIKALCDLGASLNLMPLAVYKKLGLGDPTPTNMRLIAKWTLIVDMELNEPKFRLNDKEAHFEIHSSMTQQKEVSVLSTVDVFYKDGKGVSTGLEMAPKGKNLKSTKKVTKESASRRLFNEESDYEEEKPLVRKQKKKQSLKKTPPPPPVKVEESEENQLEFEEHESGQPEFEGPSTESPFAEPQDDKDSPIRETMVKCKNPKVRDNTRWRAVKRPIFEEKRIITKGLIRYPKVEQKFHGYDLGWTTRGGNSFLPALVRDFYANYQAHLENMCREGENAADQPLLDKVLVQGVMVDISEATINRFLYGPNFTPQATLPTFYVQLNHRENQQNWLDTLIADEQPKWLINSDERIFKASLNSEVRFWCGIVRTWLMPTDGDNIFADDRAILVTSFVANLKLNFGEIIAKEIKNHVSRSDIAYPFPYLIIRLCRAANVLKIIGLEELLAKKTHNLIRNEEIQPRLMFYRGTEIPTDPLVTSTSLVPNAEMPDSEPVPPTSATMAESSVPKTETIPSAVMPTTKFAFNLINFRRVAKQSK